MGFWGALIMSIFATVFMMAAIILPGGNHHLVLILPILVLAAFLACAFRVRRGLTSVHKPSEQASNVIMWSTIGEGIGIFLAVNVVNNLGHPEWMLPAITLVVGLHFLPMAFAIPFKPFHVLAALLVAGSIVGALLSKPYGATISAVIAGLGLWAAAVLALRREIHGTLTPCSGAG